MDGYKIVQNAFDSFKTINLHIYFQNARQNEIFVFNAHKSYPEKDKNPNE